MYYSGWREPFRASFAATAAAARRGAARADRPDRRQPGRDRIGAVRRLPAVPTPRPSGHTATRSSWLRPRDERVRGTPGATGTRPRRISSPRGGTSSRCSASLGAENVTWLWTVNIIEKRPAAFPAPGPWWPGSSYVTWVGIDGYYATAVHDLRLAVRADHRRGARADQRPDPDRRDGRRGPRRASRPRSPTCSPASAPTGCWGSPGSTPSGSRTGGWPAQPRPGRVPPGRAAVPRGRRHELGPHARNTRPIPVPRSTPPAGGASRRSRLVIVDGHPVAAAVACGSR